MPRAIHLLALSFMLVATAHAQSTALRPGQAAATLDGGATWRFDLEPAAFRHEETRVNEHRCRSCRGQHHYYRYDQSFAEGAIERIAFDFDVVGDRTSFRTGRGPYPARGHVSIWTRGASEPQRPDAEVQVERVRSGTQSLNLTLTFQDGPLRTLRLVLPN